MSKLKIFNNEEFGEIRTVQLDNETYFIGKDIAEVLGYSNTKDAIATHVQEDDKRILQRSEITTFDIPNRGMTIINESGLYALIFGSKLESAKRFKHWVTSEVLPSIRKTGSYHQPKTAMEILELQFNAIKEMDSKLSIVNEDLQTFKQDMPILGIEESKITTAVKRKGVNCLGGKQSEAYQDKSLRGKVYADIYNQLKREFGVASYKAIKRNQCDLAVNIIDDYEMPLVLAGQVDDFNNQLCFLY